MKRWAKYGIICLAVIGISTIWWISIDHNTYSKNGIFFKYPPSNPGGDKGSKWEERSMNDTDIIAYISNHNYTSFFVYNYSKKGFKTFQEAEDYEKQEWMKPSGYNKMISERNMTINSMNAYELIINRSIPDMRSPIGQYTTKIIILESPSGFYKLMCDSPEVSYYKYESDFDFMIDSFKVQ